MRSTQRWPKYIFAPEIEARARPEAQPEDRAEAEDMRPRRRGEPEPEAGAEARGPEGGTKSFVLSLRITTVYNGEEQGALRGNGKMDRKNKKKPKKPK